MRLSNLSLDQKKLTGFLRNALIAVALLLKACGSQNLPEPVLDEVCLNFAQPRCIEGAYVGYQVEIVFRGRRLYPLYQVNLDNQQEPSPLGQFRAWLGGQPILQLSQQPQKIRGRDTLTGILPASLSIGLYDARLELPSGAQIVLEEAFWIVPPS